MQNADVDRAVASVRRILEALWRQRRTARVELDVRDGTPRRRVRALASVAVDVDAAADPMVE